MIKVRTRKAGDSLGLAITKGSICMNRWHTPRLVVGTLVASVAMLFSPLVSLADALTESQTRLFNDVKYLASDDLEGRGVETEGINKAADFIRDEFQKAGLNVTEVKGGAYQP